MVNRCICSNIYFEKVKEISQRQGFQTVKELAENGICCRHCKLCEPYIEEMFKTGRTSFEPKQFS